MKQVQHLLRAAVYPVTIVLLVLVILYSGLQIWESAVSRPTQDVEETVPSKTILRDGVEYFPRQDITTLLLMGIDQEGPVEASGSYTNPGMADVNILLIFDESDKVCHAIHLNRDTMLEMPVLGLGGKQAGTRFGQLALSHTYGTGLEDSCLNTVQTVSGLLGGVHIHYYLSLNLDAISIVNDSLGGVTVEVTEDFSQVDDTIGLGTVTLRGQQAVNYIRSRRNVGDQLNLSRMQRHIAYLQGLVHAFENRQETAADLLAATYEKVQPYIVTNCSLDAMTGLLEHYSSYPLGQVLSLEGTNVKGEEYYEFYPDEEKLDALVLRLLYAEKK